MRGPPERVERERIAKEQFHTKKTPQKSKEQRVAQAAVSERVRVRDSVAKPNDIEIRDNTGQGSNHIEQARCAAVQAPGDAERHQRMGEYGRHRPELGRVSMKDKQIAVVTGANRGIGLEICRQLAENGLEVILTARRPQAAEAASQSLSSVGTVRAHGLDVTSDDSVRDLADFIEREYGRLNVLINNAGIMLSDGPGTGLLDVPLDTVRQTMETNTYGPLRLVRKLHGLLQAGKPARIVNMSSGLGQLFDMTGGNVAYRLSKTALNALTRIMAAELPGILVNSVCPGWVRTDMGGSGAPRSVQTGADTPVWLATDPDLQETGAFFRDRKRIEW